MGWITDLMKEYPALSVAKERLAFAQEKYDALESENKELKEEIERLRADNRDYKEQLNALRKGQTEDLEEIEVRILEILGSDNGLELPVADVAADLGISVPKAEFYLHRLSDSEHVLLPANHWAGASV